MKKASLIIVLLLTFSYSNGGVSVIDINNKTLSINKENTTMVESKTKRVQKFRFKKSFKSIDEEIIRNETFRFFYTNSNTKK